MKTIQDVRNDISETISLIKDAEAMSDKKSKTLAKKLRTKLVELNFYVLYLETAPSEQQCREAVQRLSDQIDRIVKGLESRYGKKVNPEVAFKSHFKDRGVPKLRQQIQQLNYLLN